MAVPKRKTSYSKTHKRRSHQAATARDLSICPNCNQRKLPHRICDSCGYYKGVEVAAKKEGE